MIKELVIATRNMGKLEEFKVLMKDLPVEIKCLEDFGEIEEPAETGRTFAANARLKAVYYAKKTGVPCIADDSGLFCLGIDLAPGVYSARYASDHDFKLNRDKLISDLKGKDNTAYFNCTMVLYHIDGTYEEAVGKTYGKIIDEERGDTSFGYDSIFLSDDLGITFGEASSEQKNKVSHRYRALVKIKDLMD